MTRTDAEGVKSRPGFRDGQDMHQGKENGGEVKVVVDDTGARMGPRCFCMGCRLLFSVPGRRPMLKTAPAPVGVGRQRSPWQRH